MVVYLGADHRGFALKERLKSFLSAKGYTLVDKGNEVHDEDDDYTHFAAKVAADVSKDPEGARGILACGSGVGMDVAANKFKGVRSALAISSDQIRNARRDDDANVLTFAADSVAPEDAETIALAFLTTPFDKKERHMRRLRSIAKLEEGGPA